MAECDGCKDLGVTMHPEDCACPCHTVERIEAMGLHVDFHLTPKVSARW